MEGHPFLSPPIPAIDFGTARPVVLAWSCLTGSYEDHRANWQIVTPPGLPGCFYDGGDDNIAEAFFKRGAAVYIGATEVSPGSQNVEAAKAFENSYWWPNVTVGRALTDLKWRKWDDSDSGWQLWVYEYNLYGDPKYGAAPEHTPASLAPALAEEEAAEPAAALDVTIPDYVVTTAAGFDEVTIPGGGQIFEEGQYRLPYYRVTLEYPVGHEVQDVSLVERSGLRTATDLRLPVHEHAIAAVPARSVAAQAVAEGWLPEELFEWTARKNPDGTSSLLITIYPFIYNPLTTDVRFYQDYTFDIAYSTSAVRLTALDVDREAYPQGEPVHARVGVRNPGEPQDVRVDAEITTYPGGAGVAGLPMATLPGLSGEASFSLAWDGAGAEPGYYALQVTLRDVDGHVLDRASSVFRVGVASGRITHLSASPSPFRVGDDIAIRMDVQNDGTVDLSGMARIRVVGETGESVAVFEHPVTAVEPGGTATFEDVWATSGRPEGTYTVVGQVLCDGSATDPASAVVSTRMRLHLPMVVRQRR